ncbi:MAG TPA: HDIG domain-containing protein [Phycisphaerales bacterium]|nr:HDIG domain-containing protein [Phycisphaerales bacterium]
MGLFQKKSSRRNQVRKNMPLDGLANLNRLISTEVIVSILIWLLFVVVSIPILSFEFIRDQQRLALLQSTILVVLISLGGAWYILHYQRRILRNHGRAFAMASLLILTLAATKLGVLLWQRTLWATGGAVVVGIILSIAFDQRFAIGMSMFYCLLGGLAGGGTTIGIGQVRPYELTDLGLLLTMASGTLTCCFSLREIRTRMKLINVSVAAGAAVFAAAVVVGFMAEGEMPTARVYANAGWHAATTLLVGLLIQALLPIIERTFRIATGMTLLDYSDANQPLLKRLAMEAPGTFSHSLFIGSIAEAAAQAIGRNGLLCRVGAYYHDIGKINKPGYFVENEMGSVSRHKELSPAMSQLIIVGHVKDGIEMAKEYGLPAVLRQFIETHHGTTLVEPFYNEAKKKHNANGKVGKAKEAPPSKSAFRYAGPRPRTKEAGIVMLSDAVEGAVRTLQDATPAKIEVVVHNIAMRRLQDGQFDECELSFRELGQIEASIAKTLAGHYHGRIPYPTRPDEPAEGRALMTGQAKTQNQ